ncbi:MAG: hypothetical protein EXS05_12700 [Planctomycetaceae bacterium]|nr:hypothetical protein [Planctomycetaceae bacterium]
MVAAPGFAVEVFAHHLSFPIDVTFGNRGELYVAESGFSGFGNDPVKSPPARIIQILGDGKTRLIYNHSVEMHDACQHDSSVDMPEGIIPPITGITWHDGMIYVSHRSRYSVLNPETGEFRTIVNGLPVWGASVNGKPIFSPDGSMVFFVPTQSNAGVVDAHEAAIISLFQKHRAADIPGADVALAGRDFIVPLEQANNAGIYVRSPNELAAKRGNEDLLPLTHLSKLNPEHAANPTGAFMPLWTRTQPGQVVSGQPVCNGAFYRCAPDGSGLQRIAWGFRSSFGYRYHSDGRLICTHNGANPTQPRPIWFDDDTVYNVVDSEWYGWPDFFSGRSLTNPRFRAPSGAGEFVLTHETHRQLLNGADAPRQPLVRLTPHCGAQGCVFGRPEFGFSKDDLIVAELGTIVPEFEGEHLFQTPDVVEEAELVRERRPNRPPSGVDYNWPGFKVQVVNIKTGNVYALLANQKPGPATSTRGGGLERPVQVEWGPDGALYVVDYGVITLSGDRLNSHGRTGVIWRITKR